ncbi:hypothetical protein LIPSTDRAFT_113722 [Lipomyces starkeyi NRRL Y-11557]|uniref:Uncharacterized protein n=1 Tax=Lipomyces starkeyi NRRL Y-11557 TaxID=675824 RepID=A0A1E3PWI5_LIPST|nr:hypothetical protein LIPSTDRAFT_113722 [Lipomyces starkeyi NRRL Y-11557]
MRHRVFNCIHGSGTACLPLQARRGLATQTKKRRKIALNGFIGKVLSQRSDGDAEGESIRASYNSTLGQFLLPITEVRCLPKKYFNQHPFYIPDEVGRLTGLLAPTYDTLEARYKTRDIDSPNNVVLNYTSRGDFEATRKEKLSLFLAYKPAIDPNSLSPQKKMRLKEVLELILASESKDVWRELWTEVLKDLKTNPERHSALCLLTSEIVVPKSGTLLDDWTKIEFIYTDYWKRLRTPIKEGMELFYHLCRHVSTRFATNHHSNTAEHEAAQILEKIEKGLFWNLTSRLAAISLVNSYHLEGLPESCVEPYIRALLVVGNLNLPLNMILNSRIVGFSPDPALIIDFLLELCKEDGLRAQSDKPLTAIDDLVEHHMGLFRPYFISRRNPPLGISFLLERYVKTLDEIYSLFNLCLRSHYKEYCLRANERLFLQKIYDVCRDDKYLGNETQRLKVARSNIMFMFSRLTEELGHLSSRTKDTFAKLIATCDEQLAERRIARASLQDCTIIAARKGQQKN